jgi:aminopeptidase N
LSQIAVKKRSGYQAPSYLINEVDLVIELDPSKTIITSTLQFETALAPIEPNSRLPVERDLILDGEDLHLISILLNGSPFTNYQIADGKLVIAQAELAHLASFTLVVKNSIDPGNNATLEGLYLSNAAYCTQCEAEGFRKITYFLDRPDILSVYTVTIIADKTQFPQVLSNGNLVEAYDLNDDKKLVKWHDPFKKPCYLFALVAGDFDKLSDSFITMSGRKVQLELFVDKGKESQGNHALASLKKAMKWDEDIYGLEYDLDIFMVVAVDFFNMGAMENKGLNVFNSKFVLADPNIATDNDFFNI